MHYKEVIKKIASSQQYLWEPHGKRLNNIIKSLYDKTKLVVVSFSLRKLQLVTLVTFKNKYNLSKSDDV